MVGLGEGLGDGWYGGSVDIFVDNDQSRPVIDQLRPVQTVTGSDQSCNR